MEVSNVSSWDQIRLEWAAWASVKWTNFKYYTIYYLGIFLPMFLVNLLVKDFDLNKLKQEDSEGDEAVIDIRNIQFRIDGGKTVPICHNITSRAIWYLYFMDSDYDGFMEYMYRCLPWNDINGKVMDHHYKPLHRVFVCYWITYDDKDPQYKVANISTNGKFSFVENIEGTIDPNQETNILFNTISLLPEE